MQAPAALKSGDPLTFTLFIAVLLHALLLFGVAFTAPQGHLPHVMEVTLALHRSSQENPHADYIAQANQQGGGTADDARLLTSPHQSPFKSDEVHEVQPKQQTAASPPVADVRRQLIVTLSTAPYHHDNTVAQDITPPQPPAQDAQQAAEESQEIATLEARLAAKENDYAKRTRTRTLTSASTRSAPEAAYLDAFRSRVEQIGNRDYPEQARAQHMLGNVRLLVAVNSNGSIADITVLQGSGHQMLDAAAVHSVRAAAPFPAFPLEIRRDTDVLKIIRTWKFTETLETDES